MSKYQVVIDRWPQGNPRTEQARIAGLALFEKIEAAGQRKDEIAKDHRLTPVGAREKVREFMAGELRQALLAARVELKNGYDRIQTARDTLRMPAWDKTDLVAALLRQEVRMQWKALPVNQRIAMLGDVNADPLLVSAVFELPAVFTGIPAEVRDKILETHIEKAHPAVTQAIKEDSANFEHLQAAIKIGAYEVQQLGEFADHEVPHFVFDIPPAKVGEQPVEVPPLVPVSGNAVVAQLA